MFESKTKGSSPPINALSFSSFGFSLIYEIGIGASGSDPSIALA